MRSPSIETIADSVAVPRFRTLLIVGLAGFAALLALLGVYGALSFSVARRRREMGVRMALGARSNDVVQDVVAEGVRLALYGLVFGMGLAWLAARSVRAFLFDTAVTDPATWAAVVVSLLVVVVLAAYLPARRAATVDPVTVLSGD